MKQSSIMRPLNNACAATKRGGTPVAPRPLARCRLQPSKHEHADEHGGDEAQDQRNALD